MIGGAPEQLGVLSSVSVHCRGTKGLERPCSMFVELDIYEKPASGLLSLFDRRREST